MRSSCNEAIKGVQGRGSQWCRWLSESIIKGSTLFGAWRRSRFNLFAVWQPTIYDREIASFRQCALSSTSQRLKFHSSIPVIIVFTFMETHCLLSEYKINQNKKQDKFFPVSPIIITSMTTGQCKMFGIHHSITIELFNEHRPGVSKQGGLSR